MGPCGRDAFLAAGVGVRLDIPDALRRGRGRCDERRHGGGRHGGGGGRRARGGRRGRACRRGRGHGSRRWRGRAVHDDVLGAPGLRPGDGLVRRQGRRPRHVAAGGQRRRRPRPRPARPRPASASASASTARVGVARTSRPHARHVNDQPCTGLRHAAQVPGGVTWRIASAIGPVTPPRTAQTAGLRWRFRASHAERAPNPIAQITANTSRSIATTFIGASSTADGGSDVEPQLAGLERLRIPHAAAGLDAAEPGEPAERLRIEPGPPGLRPERGGDELELARRARPRRGATNAFGRPRSPSYFGISYSRMRWSRNVFHASSATSRWSWCASSVRGTRMRSGEVDALERLEPLLDLGEARGKEAVARSWKTISRSRRRRGTTRAERVPSRTRSAVPLITTQVATRRRPPAAARGSCPPAPISMSSGWAPRHRSLEPAGRQRSERQHRRQASRSWSQTAHGGVPPSYISSSVLLVLERVHRRPEAVVPEGHQPALLDQPPERLLDELLALADVVEDLPAEDEVAAVDPGRALANVADRLHRASVVGLHEVERVGRAHGEEGGDVVRRAEGLDELRERSVRQRVAVVGEEHVVIPEVRPDRRGAAGRRSCARPCRRT